jgi:ABC-type uncharacterized transport system substrate-binding protein
MISRRAFVRSLSCSLLCVPLGTYGQTAGKVYRLGQLREGAVPLSRVFWEAMEGYGWFEDRNISVHARFAKATGELRAFAKELVELNVDVIVTDGTPATRAAKATTGTIPIVFAIGGDPVRQEFVSSLARPNANLTGITFGAYTAKQLQILKEALPKASLVAIPAGEGAGLAGTASSLGVKLIEIAANGPDDLNSFFQSVLSSKADAVLFPNIAWTGPHQRTIGAMAIKNRVPLIATWRPFAQTGALLTYGPTPLAYQARLAAQVDKILKGTKVSDIPVEQPTHFDLVINLKTAKTLGITIPQSLFQRADERIED